MGMEVRTIDGGRYKRRLVMSTIQCRAVPKAGQLHAIPLLGSETLEKCRGGYTGGRRWGVVLMEGQTTNGDYIERRRSTALGQHIWFQL